MAVAGPSARASLRSLSAAQPIAPAPARRHLSSAPLRSAVAGPSHAVGRRSAHVLTAARRPAASTSSASVSPSSFASATGARRLVQTFVPKRTTYRTKFKGRIPLPRGGTIRGTNLAFGEWGVRVTKPCILTTKSLLSIQEAVRRQLRLVKNGQMCAGRSERRSDRAGTFASSRIRVSPSRATRTSALVQEARFDAARMGKGKGPFSYYHCRVSVGKVVVEIGSPDTSIEPELAKRSAYARRSIALTCQS